MIFMIGSGMLGIYDLCMNLSVSYAFSWSSNAMALLDLDVTLIIIRASCISILCCSRKPNCTFISVLLLC